MAGNLTDEEKLRQARAFVEAVRKLALKRKLNYFVVTDGASGTSNNGNPAVRNAREAQIKWELEHGADPYEDWSAKPISFPKGEIESLKGRDSIITHRVSDEFGKYRKGDRVSVPWGDEYVVDSRTDLNDVSGSPYFGELTDEQRGELGKYKKIALLKLVRPMGKNAAHEISSPEELDALYAKLKYRILNQKTNRPFFNTNRDTFEKWHLLSPEQIKKHKIGICWDTAAMTDAELTRLGVPHENYFAHAKDAYHKPTHAFNVYKDENGDWRWIEGSWEKYKGNDWKERRKRDLVRRIVKALESEGFDEATGGDKQVLHKIEKFPEAGVDGRQFYDAMLSSPVKKADAAKYSLKEDPTYEDVLKVFGKLDFDDRANLVPRHPDFFRKVPDDMLFDRQVAIDVDGNPVGFNEFYYGRNKLGRRQPPHNAIAVVPEARGNGLSRLMAEAAVRKARKEKVRRLVWEAFADNDGSIRAALSAGFEDATPKNAKGYRRFVYRVSEKKASSLDLKKLFPNSKFPTKDELKEKEKSFSVGDRVKVSDHIRCLQKGHVGTIVRIDPEDESGWKSFVVKFDDKKCGSMGFSSGNIDKVVEKKAEFIKKADPPGRGLNSPNPYVRTLNKEFGYVAPHPYSKQFVNTKEFNPGFIEDSPYYKQMTWLTKQDPRGGSGFPTFFDPRHPMNRLAMYDLARMQGNPHISTSYYPGGTPEKSVIMQGPWPSNEKSIGHEVGHYIDHSKNGLPSGVTSPQDRLRHEETAWDLAGIPVDDPQRQLALAGYRPDIGLNDRIELTKNLTAEQARTYAPPSAYIGKYTGKGYPIAYDYPSLVQAYNRNPGLVSRILASWNEKDKMGRPYVSEAERWYRDHGAEQN